MELFPTDNMDYYIIDDLDKRRVIDTNITWEVQTFLHSSTSLSPCGAFCGIGYQTQTKVIELTENSCIGFNCQVSALVKEKKKCYAGKCPGWYLPYENVFLLCFFFSCICES